MRKRALVLAGLVVVGLGAAVALWWYLTTRPDYLLARGQEALRRKDVKAAQAVATRLAADGHADHAHLLQGELFFRLTSSAEDWEDPSPNDRYLCQQALLEFNQIKDEAALRVQAAALTGQCLLFLKQLGEAERAFQFVLSEQPDHVDAHRGLAAVYYDLGALDQAGKHLEEVARLDPEDGRPHRLLGLIHKDLDHAELAVDHYRAALRRQLSEAKGEEVRLELAEVLVRLARYAEALAYVEGSTPAPADVGKAVALRAECAWGLGRTAEAQRLLDEALDQDHRAQEILRLRAKLHQEAGEDKQAVHLLEEVLARDPHDYTSRYQLALALESQGRKKEAAEQRQLGDQTKELLGEMTRLTDQAMDHPRDAGVRRRLAEVCEKLEKRELAAMWRRAADALKAAAK